MKQRYKKPIEMGKNSNLQGFDLATIIFGAIFATYAPSSLNYIKLKGLSTKTLIWQLWTELKFVKI